LKVRIDNANNRFHGRQGELIGPEPWFEEHGHAPLVAVKVEKGPNGVTFVRHDEIVPLHEPE
jgi:hypothetical protein